MGGIRYFGNGLLENISKLYFKLNKFDLAYKYSNYAIKIDSKIDNAYSIAHNSYIQLTREIDQKDYDICYKYGDSDKNFRAPAET